MPMVGFPIGEYRPILLTFEDIDQPKAQFAEKLMEPVHGYIIDIPSNIRMIVYITVFKITLPQKWTYSAEISENG